MDQRLLEEQLEAYMEGQASIDGFCGTLLVAQSGKQLLCKGWGLANREHGVSNQVQTKFRIGSVSKPFTATAILLLHEQ